MSDKLQVYTDGASKGNPGKASIGVTILKDGHEIESISKFIGMQTNNYAEYTAMIEALKLLADKFNGAELECFADSELMIKQLNGVYKVKNANIKPLYESIKKLLNNFSAVSFTHVRREFNKRADELANLALI